jgi:hypothetical protein
LDRNVAQFGETFAGLFANLSDWAMALAVISALAFALARLRLFPEREAKTAPRLSAVTQPPILEAERTRAQWARTSAAGRPTISSLQADAASNIDAAEHALNRLLAECAVVMTLPMSPTLQAQRELKVAHGTASSSLAA